MTSVDSDPDLEMILADMRQEFIESAEDRLDEVEAAVARMLANKGRVEYEQLEVKRHIHTLKGVGSSYGFPAITVWSHALEDYLETIKELGVDQLWDVQLFVDRIRDVLETGLNPVDAEIAAAVKSMPLRGLTRERSPLKSGMSVMLLMPKGLQRKIISRELTTFGFRVIIAESSLSAVDLAITLRPDVVISSFVLDRISGLELARVLGAIDATSGHKFLLMTASEDIDDKTVVPDHVTVVRKGRSFSAELIKFLGAQKLLK